MKECKVCKREISIKHLDDGMCLACDDAESIIDEGLDMSDHGPEGNHFTAETAREKLEFLIAKGWMPPVGK